MMGDKRYEVRCYTNDGAAHRGYADTLDEAISILRSQPDVKAHRGLYVWDRVEKRPIFDEPRQTRN